MSSFYKTCFYNVLLLMALAMPPLSGGCERQSDPPVQPRSGAPATPKSQEATPAAQPATPPAAAIETSNQNSRMGDASITARVKTALMTDDRVKGLAIDVDTSNAEVTLKGALETDEQINRAIELARSVDGVRTVVNRLTVKGEDNAANTNQG